MLAVRRALPPLLVLVAAALLCGHSLLFNFVTDDAFISFVYARNLAQHGQLVFNLGERVEGYTNFLWTVLLAGALRLGLAPELTSRLFATLAACVTLGICARGARWLRQDPALTPGDAMVALVLCAVPGYACWSSGGLETQLFTMLVTMGALRYLRELGPAGDGRVTWPSALCFGLAALTRPEGYLFFGLTGLHCLVLRRGRVGLAELRWGVVFLALVVPHLLWRRVYYGYWVPNTFYVKASGLPGTWAQGGYYLLLFAQQTKLWVMPLLAGAALLLHRGGGAFRLAGAYGMLLCAVFLLYVASVGGDFMGLHRFLMPVVPLGVLLGVTGARLLIPARPAWLQPGLAALALGMHAFNSYVVDQRALTFIGADRGIDTPGYLRHYTADRAAIGKWLGRHVRPDDYQVVGGAGAQVYYAGIRALDSFGLCDAYVAHQVPAQSVRPGHQKFAPLSYVLAQHPTILTYNVYRIADAPYQPSPAERAEWRARGFHYVSVEIPGLSRPWYSFLKRVDRTLGPLPKDDSSD